jgi:hypothetical protein
MVGAVRASRPPPSRLEGTLLSDLDRAVPAAPERREPRRRRRFKIPGWTVLIVFVGAIGLFAWYSSREAVPVEPVTVVSWVCEEEIEEEQPWSYYLDAGCREAPADTSLTLMHLAGELNTQSTADGAAEFDRVAVNSIELNLRIDTAEPRQALIMFNAAGETPQYLQAFNHDRARQRWTGPFRPRGDQSFVLLHGPVIEVP